MPRPPVKPIHFKWVLKGRARDEDTSHAVGYVRRPDLLSLQRRNQYRSDGLCHYIASAHVNEFCCDAVLRRFSGRRVATGDGWRCHQVTHHFLTLVQIPVTDLIPASAVPPLSTVLLLGTAYEAQRPQSRRQNNSRNKDSRREDSETRKTNILITFYRWHQRHRFLLREPLPSVSPPELFSCYRKDLREASSRNGSSP